jgi:hypothetical protein
VFHQDAGKDLYCKNVGCRNLRISPYLSEEKIEIISSEKKRRNALKPWKIMCQKNKTDWAGREKFMLLFKKSLQLYTKNG